jgi:predicted DNA-binding protein YlxM (UPF0122 family)
VEALLKQMSLLDYDEDNDARRIFIEDSKQKKEIGKSARIKATKSKKLVPNKRELNKLNGEVVTMSLYDTIMTYKEFQKLSKEDKLKTLEGYEANGKTRQEIADAWEKKLQAIHDLVYRLKKDLEKGTTSNKKTQTNKKATPARKSVATLAKEETSEELTTTVEQEQFYPFTLSLVRSMNGEQIQDWMLKAIELVDVSKKLLVIFDIKKCSKKSPTKFSFSVQLSDEFTQEQFNEEIVNMVSILNKNDKYLLSFELKELHTTVEDKVSEQALHDTAATKEQGE